MGAPLLYVYTAHGLRIGSEIRLTAFDHSNAPVQADGPFDLMIKRAKLDRASDLHLEIDGDDWVFTFGEIGTFLLRGTDSILVDVAPELPDDLVSLPLLGTVLATFLAKRGAFVLHGSAVSINGRAAVFVGDKGAGKSTTAAAFTAAGHPLLCDDIAAFEPTDGAAPWNLLPGLPQLKLDTRAASLFPLSSRIVQGATLHHALDKDHHHLQQSDVAPAPVAAICVLVRGEKAEAVALPPHLALEEMLRHSYISRYDSRLLPPDMVVRRLHHCSDVINRHRIIRLVVPDGLSGLSDAVATLGDLIVKD